MTTSIDTDLLTETPPGPIPWRGGALIADLEAAGLTGRGGAGFPAWRKATTAARGRGAVVIANGAEGEPLSSKDATLLRRNPWGYPVPHQPGPIQVPENLTRHAGKAAALCPFLALRLQQSAAPGPNIVSGD